MNTQHLATAERIFSKTSANPNIVRAFAGTVHTMGVVRALEWLEDKKGAGDLCALLLRELGVPSVSSLESQPRPELIAVHRHLMALTESLHLIEAVKRHG